jgi:hypothetical protein
MKYILSRIERLTLAHIFSCFDLPLNYSEMEWPEANSQTLLHCLSAFLQESSSDTFQIQLNNTSFYLRPDFELLKQSSFNLFQFRYTTPIHNPIFFLFRIVSTTRSEKKLLQNSHVIKTRKNFLDLKHVFGGEKNARNYHVSYWMLNVWMAECSFVDKKTNR